MDNNNNLNFLERSEISFDELRMKQSVRTTFKLPKEIITLLGLIASQLGIKQKSVLDRLTEDTGLLDRLAKDAKQMIDGDENRQAKTYVMSRSSLQSINSAAKKQKIPRDILVEVSIKRLLPIIETELKRHIERKKIVEEMKDHLQYWKALHSRAKALLGEDDELSMMIDKQAELAKKNIETADTIIKKGMPMEEW